MPANLVETYTMRAAYAPINEGEPSEILVAAKDVVRWLRHLEINVYHGRSRSNSRNAIKHVADNFAGQLEQIHSALDRGESIFNRTFTQTTPADVSP